MITSSPKGAVNPTLFEYYRKGLRRPANDVWVIAPSNGFEAIGCSRHGAYGSAYGAQVILPKRLLAHSADASNRTLRDYESLLHDSFESPFHTDTAAQNAKAGAEELGRVATTLKLSLEAFSAHARTLSSPDELSFYIAQQVMQQVAPSLLFITLHDIDVAHSGAFSLYLDAIQRADRLCAQLWQSVEANPEYKGRTTMLIMPDFGRDGDGEVRVVFQHHRTGSPMARTTWMLALGKGARPGTLVHRPIELYRLACSPQLDSSTDLRRLLLLAVRSLSFCDPNIAYCRVVQCISSCGPRVSASVFGGAALYPTCSLAQFP